MIGRFFRAPLRATGGRNGPLDPTTLLTQCSIGCLILVTTLLNLRMDLPFGRADISWKLALAMAADAHLHFGQDVIYTYGPLAYLSAGFATAGDGVEVIAFRALLGFCVGVALAIQFRMHGSTMQKIVFAGSMLAAIYLACLDAMTPPLLLLQIMYLHASQRRIAPFVALAFGTIDGLLALTKCTVALSACAMFLVYFAVRAVRVGSQPRTAGDVLLPALLIFCAMMSAGIAFFGPVAAAWAAVAWCLAALSAFTATRTNAIPIATYGMAAASLGACCIGASTHAFVAYVIASAQVIAGYSGAMGLPGPEYATAFAAGAMVALAYLCYRERATISLECGAAVLAATYVAFKEGYVRQDGIHTLYFLEALIAACAFAYRFVASGRSRAITAALLFVSFGYCVTVASDVARRSGDELATLQTPLQPINVLTGVVGPYRSLAVPDLPGYRLPTRDAERLQREPVDVVPYDTAVVFENGFHWAPEPMFQWFMNDTPFLDRWDAERLDDRRRSHVLLSMKSFDGRTIMSDAPLSFRTLLCDYALDRSNGRDWTATMSAIPFLILRPSPPGCEPPKVLGTHVLGWGDVYDVPASRAQHVQFLRIDVRYSLLGELVALLFRAPEVDLAISTRATSRVYRIVPAVANEGILIDPFPENWDQFHQLFAGKLQSRTTKVAMLTADPRLFEPVIRLELDSVHRDTAARAKPCGQSRERPRASIRGSRARRRSAGWASCRNPDP